MSAARAVLGDLGRFAADLARSMRRLAARGLPEVLAIELAARILGTFLVAFAGSVGTTSAVGGLALTALTALVRLVAMILQILVLLRAMRSTPPPPVGGAARLESAVSGLAASVLPAFLLLTAWGIFDADLREYALTALAGIDWFAEGAGVGAVLDVPIDVLTVSLLAACLVLRGVLRRFERRGRTRRKGVSVATLVLEGLWTFLAVSILGRLVGMAAEWFATTRLASGVDDIRSAIDGVLGGWLLGAWDAAGEAWHDVTLPLVWLTLVGIVLLGARPELVPEPVEAPRPARWWTRLVEAMPSPIDDVLEEVTDDLHDRWVPVVATLRQVWGAGIVPLAGAIVAWYVVQVACGWLTVLLVHALGVQAFPLAEAVANAGSALGDAIAGALGLVASVAALDALRLGAAPPRAQPSTDQEAAGSTGTPSQSVSPPMSRRASSTSPAGTTKPTTPETGPSSE